VVAWDGDEESVSPTLQLEASTPAADEFFELEKLTGAQIKLEMGKQPQEEASSPPTSSEPSSPRYLKALKRQEEARKAGHSDAAGSASPWEGIIPEEDNEEELCEVSD